MAARRLLPLLAFVAAASLLAAADARPCPHTFLVAFPADPNPSNVDVRRHHLGFPHVATVVTVFRVRRLGPHVPHHFTHRHPHLHSIPANVQIRRPDLPHPRPAAAAADGPQERARGVLVVVVGLLFGVACGALTAASVYLVWSMVAGAAAAAAASPYDELYDDDEDEEASDTESPKKVGYVIIQELEVHDGGKN